MEPSFDDTVILAVSGVGRHTFDFAGLVSTWWLFDTALKLHIQISFYFLVQTQRTSCISIMLVVLVPTYILCSLSLSLYMLRTSITYAGISKFFQFDRSVCRPKLSFPSINRKSCITNLCPKTKLYKKRCNP